MSNNIALNYESHNGEWVKSKLSLGIDSGFAGEYSRTIVDPVSDWGEVVPALDNAIWVIEHAYVFFEGVAPNICIPYVYRNGIYVRLLWVYHEVINKLFVINTPFTLIAGDTLKIRTYGGTVGSKSILGYMGRKILTDD